MDKKHFADYKAPAVGLPPLAEAQLNSYAWFFKKGIRELFDEVSPVPDFTEKEFSLELVSYYLDES